MSYSIEGLRAVSDDQLIREHDAIAVSTSVGVNYYLDELRRREQERAIAASERLSRTTVRLAWASTVLSAVAVVAAVVALFAR